VIRSHLILFISGLALGSTISYLFFPNTKIVEKEILSSINQGEIKSAEEDRCPAHLMGRAPVLPPPKFREDLGERLTTNAFGEVKITWSSVDQAKRYHLQVFDSRGKPFKTLTTSRTILYVKDLPFNKDLEETPYKIALQTENADGEVGELGTLKDLGVKRLLSLYAPSIRGINIEE
jgi:hypothetical protein